MEFNLIKEYAVNGQITGQGKYFYSSGGGVYTGEWKNNNRHGEGTMIWNDGVKQVAIWEMDKPVKTISLSKNFIFKGGSEWKDGDIINKKDPSNFIKLSFVEKKKVMGYDKRTLSNKYTKDGWGKSSFTVFVFNASFENSKDILINVNDEFKTNKKAKKQAIKWAKIYGQMPKFLKKNVKEINIHKGKVGWAGGQGTILIHTDYLTNENKKYAEELMFHELTHASLDWWWGGSVNEEKWLNAVSTDKYYISEYAWELPGNEDLAETVLWWYASRCKVDRISKKNNEFRVNVLQGTTGSGKTLVYFNLVKDKIKQNKQAIILLPEIGLTGEFEKKFIDFFGFKPAIWHSGVTPKNKKKISRILNENNYSGEDCILILRTILKKSKRLLDIIKRYEVNKDINLSLSNTKPPIFWKEKENVKKQVFLWKLRDLQEKIYELSEIEILIKSNSNNSLNIVSDFIVNV